MSIISQGLTTALLIAQGYGHAPVAGVSPLLNAQYPFGDIAFSRLVAPQEPVILSEMIVPVVGGSGTPVGGVRILSMVPVGLLSLETVTALAGQLSLAKTPLPFPDVRVVRGNAPQIPKMNTIMGLSSGAYGSGPYGSGPYGGA